MSASFWYPTPERVLRISSSKQNEIGRGLLTFLRKSGNEHHCSENSSEYFLGLHASRGI